MLPGFRLGKDDLRVELEHSKVTRTEALKLESQDAKKLLGASGYTFTESFDEKKAQKSFLIQGKGKAAPTVIVPPEIA